VRGSYTDAGSTASKQAIPAQPGEKTMTAANSTPSPNTAQPQSTARPPNAIQSPSSTRHNPSPQTLTGKVALVTGASSGIGRASAIELARRGAKVVVSARRRAEIDSLVDELRKQGLEATAFVADINVEKDIIDLVAKTIATYRQIDIAFNNAGTEGEFTPFVEQSNAVYDTIFNANVRGVFWSMKHEAKAMLAQGRGTIINNASMGGVIGFANAGLYIASKHAVLGLTKTASIEWFRQGVRVNSINPGLIDTPFQDRIWPSEQAKKDFGTASVPGRMGTAEEMAKVVAFLASDDASYVSGTGLLADGGYTVA
jgi:NAD(P)-dependent dehydrogenase (short-subunit alcohol dehydrogenase family)